MKKIFYTLLILLMLLIFVGVFAFIDQEKLVDRFINRQSDALSFRTDLLEDNNDIKLVTVGTGSPLPGQRVMSCNAVFVGGRFFLFDIGSGAARAIESIRLPLDQLDGIFITHWHADHYMDLPELVNRSWLLGRQKDLHLYGPEPIDTIVKGMSLLLGIENHFRIEHHGSDLFDVDKALVESHKIDLDDRGYRLIYDKEGIVIEAFAVDHEPVSPALGYRIRYKGKTLVISGDTRRTDQIITYAQDADILLHEALAFSLIERTIALQRENNNHRAAAILEDVLDFHTNPRQAAEVAQAAGAKKLILTHLGPAPENPISRRFYAPDLEDVYEGSVLLAEDGDLYIIE